VGEGGESSPMHAGKRTTRVSHVSPLLPNRGPQVSFLSRGLVALALLFPVAAHAQWQLLDPPTTADLRGIDNVGGGVAWASGTGGTVVRTEDGGYMWQHCSTPPGAEKLDFRGIQAFDENTAIVMSSGPGDQSRLYKTTDGCQSWTLLFTNPDKDGFWDALVWDGNEDTIFILGDPVQGEFPLFFQTGGRGEFLRGWNNHPIPAPTGEAAFAASNSLLVLGAGAGKFAFITGGNQSEIIHEEHGPDGAKGAFSKWSRQALPFGHGPASGAFSMAVRPDNKQDRDWRQVVVVGGNYTRPDDQSQTAAFSSDGGYRFHSAQTPPHGYRSAVAYDADHKTWITVGPNGTDISTDDGRTWTPLHPSASDHDAPDADQHWNALSLPYAVGPHGRIGKLRNDALPEPVKTRP
jgi:photosystem II stability/assembly factor-like uncharacterized protein